MPTSLADVAKSRRPLRLLLQPRGCCLRTQKHLDRIYSFRGCAPSLAPDVSAMLRRAATQSGFLRVSSKRSMAPLHRRNTRSVRLSSSVSRSSCELPLALSDATASARVECTQRCDFALRGCLLLDARRCASVARLQSCQGVRPLPASRREIHDCLSP